MTRPLGNLRRPSWRTYAAIASAVMIVIFGGLLFPTDGGLGFLAFASAIALVLTICGELLGVLNRWLARRRLRALQPRTLAGLAERCWLLALVGRRGGPRFDAAEWISRTGHNGPRVVCCEFGLASTAPDVDSTEEVALTPWVEESPRRRRAIWFGLVLVCLLAGMFTTVGLRLGGGFAGIIPSMACTVVLLAMLARLGLLRQVLSTVSISPAGVRALRASRTIEFARDDSVLVLEPIGTSERVLLHWARKDGRSLSFSVGIGPGSKALDRILSRWCWRSGQDRRPSRALYRDAEPIPGPAKDGTVGNRS